MHVYKYISRPICMYVVIYAYMQAYMGMHMQTYIGSVFVCVLLVKLAYVHIWKYISRHICMYVVIYAYMQEYMGVHMEPYMGMRFWCFVCWLQAFGAKTRGAGEGEREWGGKRVGKSPFGAKISAK